MHGIEQAQTIPRPMPDPGVSALEKKMRLSEAKEDLETMSEDWQ
jgi:hypothetical protein